MELKEKTREEKIEELEEILAQAAERISMEKGKKAS
jgi:hypothetical protein